MAARLDKSTAVIRNVRMSRFMTLYRRRAQPPLDAAGRCDCVRRILM